MPTYFTDLIVIVFCRLDSSPGSIFDPFAPCWPVFSELRLILILKSLLPLPGCYLLFSSSASADALETVACLTDCLPFAALFAMTFD